MVLRSRLRRARKAAERDMTDWVRVTRPGGPSTDPDTGLVTIPDTVVYEGKAKFQSSRIVTEDRMVGPGLVVVENAHLHVPVGTPLALSDVVTVISPTPGLQGTKHRVVGMVRKTHRTADRWSIEHDSGMEV